MKLREALDLIEFSTREVPVDGAVIRSLVDDIRRTLVVYGVNPDLPIEEESV